MLGPWLMSATRELLLFELLRNLNICLLVCNYYFSLHFPFVLLESKFVLPLTRSIGENFMALLNSVKV